MVTRRKLLIAGAASLGSGLIVPAIFRAQRTYAASPAISKFTEPLPIPFPEPPPKILKIAPSSHSFHSSLGEGPTWGYGGASYLGPTIEVTRGQKITIKAENNLGKHPLAEAIDLDIHGTQKSDINSPRLSVHLHEGNTDAASDGYPSATFTPGQTYTYNYNNDQEAATLWYHDHALGITRLNVMAGLAGLYLLRDTDDPVGGLGSMGIPAGPPYEVPLVIQDRSFNADGSLFYPPAPWVPEFFGDVATVNGKAWPNLNVDRTLYRFRILNGSNARFYNLRLSEKNLPIYQIGTEGGFLNSPVQLKALLLAPGERADVLIDFSKNQPGDEIVLVNNAPAPFTGMTHGKKGRRGGAGLWLPQIMKFTVNTGAAKRGEIPKRLRVNKPLIKPIEVPPVRERNLTLVEITNADGPIVLLLNYLYWDEPLINTELMERPKVDTVEQWNLINLTMDTHPIHLHLEQFQILNRQKFDVQKYLEAYLATGPRQVLDAHAPFGATVPANYPPLDPTPYLQAKPRYPAPNERGWKDIVIANPGEVTRIIVPFGAKAAPNLPYGNSFTGIYVWHCHILEHEDNEMMLPYEVVG